MYITPIWQESECLGDITSTVPPHTSSMLDQTALYDAWVHTSISKLVVSKLYNFMEIKLHFLLAQHPASTIYLG